MFIQTETTPNPATLKFLPGRDVLPAELNVATANFPDAEAAKASPLATRLFAVSGVEGVYLGSDFITVTKAASRDWTELKPALLGAIMEHFMAGLPVMNADADATSAPAADEQYDPADREIVLQIKELIDTRVRPAVAQDGGDIVFRGFERGVVYLHMQGSCAGCPSSTATLRYGIENMLKHYVPEVSEVRAVQ
ncbi:NifU family protein [uncultured Ferrovibrio sp.]|jgi:Fe-S cluster biogenesis protein NfuA|uniref:NifU family protein n=1 Tax=uncultured Ferrovibrio sp. TaxID=1576913 RepID=UPI0026344109|nr:NifU family protein [uncultured Ferrovibrio sp.]